MGWFDEAKMYLRFSTALRGFLRHTMTLEGARTLVQARLAKPAETFLRIVERAVYGYPRSPHRALLRHAGCELGDLRALVQQHGLEAVSHTCISRSTRASRLTMSKRSSKP